MSEIASVESAMSVLSVVFMVIQHDTVIRLSHIQPNLDHGFKKHLFVRFKSKSRYGT